MLFVRLNTILGCNGEDDNPFDIFVVQNPAG